MAVSGSYDFTLNRDEIITKALLILGVISAAQAPTADEIDSATKTLNLMLKAWDADGMEYAAEQIINIWNTDMVADQGVYQIGGINGDPVGKQGAPTANPVVYAPIRLPEGYVWNENDKRNIPMRQYSYTEYDSEPLWGGSENSGVPRNYIYSIRRSGNETRGYVEVYPPPSQAWLDEGWMIWFACVVPHADLDASTHNIYLPAHYELAVVLGLASLLAPEYGLPTTDQKLLEGRAQKAKMDVYEGLANEPVSLYLNVGPYHG